MKSREIQAGKTYRNLRGVCRRVDSLVDNPDNLVDSKGKIVAWTLTESKRKGQQTGTCPVYEFAWWAAAEVVPVLVDVAKETVVENPQDDAPVSAPTDLPPPSDPTPVDTAISMEPPVKVGANDLACAFTVVLTKEARGRDLEATLAAIGQIKGVATVAAVRADMQYFITRDQARREILGQLKEVLKG